MDLIKDIGKDEIRDGFLVTTDRKKGWNKVLELLVEFDRVCKKYSLKYFADAGTLIGAVRHKGFIPWDDDIDLMMFRDDYEKLKQVAEEEFSAPFVLSTAYNTGEILTMAKLMNTETTAVENMNSNRHQGMFLDIWPFDDIPDGIERNKAIFDMRQSMIAAIMNPSGVLQHIDEGMEFKPSNDFIRQYISLSAWDRFREYEKFCANHFGESENIGYPLCKNWGIDGNIKRAYYREAVYMDFECIKMPVPIDYKKILDIEFGDWSQFVRAKSLHAPEYISADIAYTTILEQINRNLRDAEKNS